MSPFVTKSWLLLMSHVYFDAFVKGFYGLFVPGPRGPLRPASRRARFSMGVIGRPSRARLAVTSTALSGARRAPASGALLRAGRRPRARTRRDSIAAKGGQVCSAPHTWDPR